MCVCVCVCVLNCPFMCVCVCVLNCPFMCVCVCVCVELSLYSQPLFNTIIRILKCVCARVRVCVCVCWIVALFSAPGNHWSNFLLLSFLECYISGIKCNFYVQLLCLNMFLRLIHIINGIDCCFFIIADEYCIVGLLYILYIPYTIYYSII